MKKNKQLYTVSTAGLTIEQRWSLGHKALAKDTKKSEA